MATKQLIENQFRRAPGAGRIAAVLLFGLFLAACSKPDEFKNVIGDTSRPVVQGPTGTIKEFVALDTLVGFLHSTFLRWNVTESNTKTVVQLEGVTVPLYNSAQTDALRKTTTYKLTVNNGKSATVTVRVADSLTTGLWNDGRKWYVADALSYEPQVINGTQVDWISHYTSELGSTRTMFYLDGSSKVVQNSPIFPQPKPSGSFVTRYDSATVSAPAVASFTWKGRIYVIDTLASDKLTVRFDSTAGGIIRHNMVRYKPEL